jgi:transposase InsO family protein
VRRNFSAGRPNLLWLVDFTYVPTWSGTAFTAFVSDVCSQRIVGWRTAARMLTELPLDALEMALWTRAGSPKGTPRSPGSLEGPRDHRLGPLRSLPVPPRPLVYVSAVSATWSAAQSSGSPSCPTRRCA